MTTIPKNIRQVGGREDRIKVYMEDYVNTYLTRLRKVHEEEGMAGVLVGQFDPAEPNAPAFVSGAFAVPLVNISGGRIHLSEKAKEQWEDAWEDYFSGQQLCGLFVCEGNRIPMRRQALFSAVREYFPRRTGLLYLLTQEGETVVYRITSKKEERLQGYYCYFERNQLMQEYMMDNLPPHHVEWEGKTTSMEGYTDLPREREGALADPVNQYRQRMGDGKGKREKNAYQWQDLSKEAPQERERKGWGAIGLCACLALVIVVSGWKLLDDQYGGIQGEDLRKRLQIQVDEWWDSAVISQETGEHVEAAVSVEVEEIPGMVYPTDAAQVVDKEEMEQESSQKSQEESGKEEEETQKVTEPEREEETLKVTEPEREEENALYTNANVMYVVQAGDSLYSISRRFYGTEAMVEVIREINQLEDADLIKKGQELWLP